jgi:uncharacterized surface protein with fasciclin (FAS1) repeats
MRFPFATIGAALALAASTTGTQAADLIDTASRSATLKIFLSAVNAAGLTETLRDNGPYTVFAPSDEAFEKLPKDTLVALLDDKPRLAKALGHLIVPGKLTITEIKPGRTETLEGKGLKLTSDNGLVTVENAARVVQSDIVADNGVIHEIDTFPLD